MGKLVDRTRLWHLVGSERLGVPFVLLAGTFLAMALAALLAALAPGLCERDDIAASEFPCSASAGVSPWRR